MVKVVVTGNTESGAGYAPFTFVVLAFIDLPPFGVWGLLAVDIGQAFVGAEQIGLASGKPSGVTTSAIMAQAARKRSSNQKVTH